MNEVSTTQKKDIRALLQSEGVKQQLAMVLPKHLTPERMARVACTAILKTPKLAECRPESLLQALMLCSQAGLEPDGRNAHLIPYGDSCQVIFDYKGLVAIAERNGVECIYADKVCENDEFTASVEDGEKKISHRINWKGDRGNAYAYYASCRRNGRLDYEVMQRSEVDAIRKRSKASGSGPWVTDYDEMAKKTVLRRMSKRWDLTAEIHEAIQSEPGFAPMKQAVVAPPTFLEAPKEEPAEAVVDPVETASLQVQVSHLIESTGATFDKFVTEVGSKLDKNADSWASFSDIPNEVCKTILRSKTAITKKLQAQ